MTPTRVDSSGRANVWMIGGLAAILTWCVPLTMFAKEMQHEKAETPRPWIIGHAAPFSQAIFTDRPTFSLGTGTVAKGRFQIETGYTFAYENAQPDVRIHTFPETLLRIGLVEDVEFRVEWPTVAVIDSNRDTTGLIDLALGFKVGVLPQKGYRPQISIAGRLSIPTGDEDLSSDGVDPEFRTIMAYALNDRIALFGNVNIAGPTSQNKRFVQVSSSAGLTSVLREHLTGFVEYFGFYPRDIATGSGHFLQTGVLYGLTYNLQLDARIGAGLTRGTDDVFTGVGVSWRF